MEFSRRKRFNYNLIQLSLLSTLGLGQLAFAQDANTPPADDQSSIERAAVKGSSGDIEKITVTARHKAETLLEIPMSVSAVSAAELADRDISYAEDLYRTLAGAAMPGDQLVLRGLSGGNDASPDTTSTFVDDVPFNYTNLTDIDRIEVLRGPQGTLYGSNAIGGTVRIITKQPQLQDFELFGSLQASQEADVAGTSDNYSVGMNIPLVSDKLALRVNFNHANSQGKFVNMNTGLQANSNDMLLRGKLRWQATPELNIVAGYMYTEEKSHGPTRGDLATPGYFYDYSATQNPDAAYGYDIGIFTVDCDPTANRAVCREGTNALKAQRGVPSRYQIWQRIDDWSKDATNLYTLSLDHDDILGFATLSYAGSYRTTKHDALRDFARLDFVNLMDDWLTEDQKDTRQTHQLRLQNLDTTSPWSWTIGAYYDKSNTPYSPHAQDEFFSATDIDSALFIAAMGVDGRQVGVDNWNNPNLMWNLTYFDDSSRELAFFADTSYLFDLGDYGDLELNAGIRRYDLRDHSSYAQLGVWATDASETGGKESGNRYKLSASWRPTNDFSVYSLYSEGYRPGGNNGPLPGLCIDDPNAVNRKDRYTSDAIKNYEVGVKSRMFGGKVDLAAAAYQIDWTDMKTDVFMETCSFTYTANGGKARSRGLELESTAWLTDDLKMIVNASYTNAEVTEDNATISAKKGDDMTMVPKYNGYLALDQGLDLFSHNANVRLDYSVYGSFKSHFNTRDEDISPAYGYMNLSGRMEVNDNINLSLHINNLFDREVTTYRRADSRSPGDTYAPQYVNYLDGRTVTLRVDYMFY
ncbi:TonB-dependent receptor [Shewanella avicenniae]|uniref:TonB-dependent receptor n=1 Tax=Shewanella avicenniae TaxID=2814294 RepID=A0ABX7QMX0_9GAMM|nr:TonB-dependent receptor [Shewanella avicenniae]QSX32248.1 TonB-dependent receptor [Shewanella avicenniae]